MGRHDHGHFTWVDLSATDMEAQTRFYQDLFGWTHHDEPVGPGMSYRMFRSGDATVAAISEMPPDFEVMGMPSSWMTYVAADDVDAVAAKASELGGTVFMPAMDVMESGRMVGIADPSGAMLMFWQAKDFVGADKYGEPGSLVWSDLNTRDQAAAADFYEALVGWNVDRSGANDPDYWTISADGEAEGGIMRMGESFPPELPPHWLVYFAVDDARSVTERAKELGGAAETEPMEIPVAVFCVLSDPAGAVFAVMQAIER